MTRDRVLGFGVFVVLAVIVALLLWQALDNITVVGLVLIVAVLAAWAWDSRR